MAPHVGMRRRKMTNGAATRAGENIEGSKGDESEDYRHRRIKGDRLWRIQLLAIPLVEEPTRCTWWNRSLLHQL